MSISYVRPADDGYGDSFLHCLSGCEGVGEPLYAIVDLLGELCELVPGCELKVLMVGEVQLEFEQ